jgi:hypothetical protein
MLYGGTLGEGAAWRDASVEMLMILPPGRIPGDGSLGHQEGSSDIHREQVIKLRCAHPPV